MKKMDQTVAAMVTFLAAVCMRNDDRIAKKIPEETIRGLIFAHLIGKKMIAETNNEGEGVIWKLSNDFKKYLDTNAPLSKSRETYIASCEDIALFLASAPKNRSASWASTHETVAFFYLNSIQWAKIDEIIHILHEKRPSLRLEIEQVRTAVFQCVLQYL